MMKSGILSITEIEDKIKILLDNLDENNFIEEFLSLYDIPKVSIKRGWKDGEYFIIKNKICYKRVSNNPLIEIDNMDKNVIISKNKPRYLIVTDFKMFYAKDNKTKETLAINFSDLPVYSEFFLAWNGIEKIDYQKENPADIKAAERFTKLYDELLKINFFETSEKEKTFNLFLIRVLFLFFSEDSGIIPKGHFTNVIKTRTHSDAVNLNETIRDLFRILDTPENQRENEPKWLNRFPYVNGKLFKEEHIELNFNSYTRKLLIDSGELLNWNEINPDILGSMIQNVANKEERQVSGMHYTSVNNILKVIQPLFLDELELEYKRLADLADDYLLRKITEKQRKEQQRHIIKQLENLLDKMTKMKFFDPACGSGNFLIITYKELRKLEIKILQKIREIQSKLKDNNIYQGTLFKQSKIKLNQFVGIELDDFAHEVAILSLYIAEHQMNVEMTQCLVDYQPQILPLRESGTIIQGNALLLDWEKILPCKNERIYIIGNPPYIGAKKQTDTQKKDLETAVSPALQYAKLDYISGWFYKATKYIYKKDAKYAFVTTNSINQGEQVSYLWSELLKYGNISFAYQSFKWGNSAARNAGVTVSIIGFSNFNNNKKILFIDNNISYGDNINPYLTFGENIIVRPSSINLSNLPLMVMGNMPRSKNLIINNENKDILVDKYPETEKYFRKFIGADEFLKGKNRNTLWINYDEYLELNKIPEFYQIFNSVTLERSKKNSAASTRKYAEKPWLFVQRGEWDSANKLSKIKDKNAIIIPRHTSESRDYIPIGFVQDDTIIGDSAMVVYDAPIWLLGIITSRMHMNWLRAIGGKLESRYRYSNDIVYNTFIIPPISTKRKNILEEAVFDMLDVREEEGESLSKLYGSAKYPMNSRLRKAHEKIDGIVDRAYRQEPFKSDMERLSFLINLYKEISEEKE